MEGIRILSVEEVQELNRDGLLKDTDGLFVQIFLFNDLQNHAGDPEPFKLAKDALARIAKTAIGRPWIVHPDGSKHVRGASKDDPKKIIDFQKQWARGEIKATWQNPLSNNVHGIARVFPEYVADVKAGKIPKSPYSSPLLFVKAQVGNEITDAEILHVQSVDIPGYDPEIAKISGMCEGMLGECMNELRLLGASGALRQFQDNYIISSQFSSSNSHSKETMSESVSTTILTAEQITKIIDDKFAALQPKSLGASGAAAAQEQETEKSLPPANEGEPAAQIAIDPKIVELQSQVDKLQAANEEAAGKLARKERADQAREIVEVELLSKSIPLTKKADRLKQLVDSKDDLASIVKYMRENRGKILGASRGDVAQFHASEEESPVDHFAYFESLGRKN